MSDIEWRHAPHIGRQREFNRGGVLVAAMAREFTDPSHSPHEPRYCKCIVNYAVGTVLSEELLGDLSEIGGTVAVLDYIDKVEDKLLLMVAGKDRDIYSRSELEDIILVNAFELVPYPQLGSCKLCGVAIDHEDSLCSGCDTRIATRREKLLELTAHDAH